MRITVSGDDLRRGVRSILKLKRSEITVNWTSGYVFLEAKSKRGTGGGYITVSYEPEIIQYDIETEAGFPVGLAVKIHDIQLAESIRIVSPGGTVSVECDIRGGDITITDYQTGKSTTIDGLLVRSARELVGDRYYTFCSVAHAGIGSLPKSVLENMMFVLKEDAIVIRVRENLAWTKTEISASSFGDREQYDILLPLDVVEAMKDMGKFEIRICRISQVTSWAWFSIVSSDGQIVVNLATELAK